MTVKTTPASNKLVKFVKDNKVVIGYVAGYATGAVIATLTISHFQKEGIVKALSEFVVVPED